MEISKYIPERKIFSVVIVGAFNPSMFHPEWFGRNGIISAEDVGIALNVENSIPTIVTPQLTIFTTSQLSIRVEQNRFSVTAEREPFDAVNDVIKKTFEKLGSLTITAYGYNYSAHYDFERDTMRNDFADRIAPKKYWKALLGDDVSGDARQGGLLSIQMNKLKPDGQGAITTVLQPSVPIKKGVYIACNDHNNLKKEEASADIAVEYIDRDIIKSLKAMEEIHQGLLLEATNEE